MTPDQHEEESWAGNTCDRLSIVDPGIDFAVLASVGIVTSVAGLALTIAGASIVLPESWASA